MIILFLIFGSILVTLIGIPLGILGVVSDNKIAKNNLMVKAQKDREELEFRQAILKNMNNKV